MGLNSSFRSGAAICALAALLCVPLSVASPQPAAASSASEASSEDANVSAKHGEWGVDLEFISETVHPGDDFYLYVNEGWIEQTAIPPERGYLNEPWAVQGQVLGDVSALLEELFGQSPHPQGTAERRLQDFYAAYMNASEVEQRGLVPIARGLDQIAAIEDYSDLAAFMARPLANSLFHTIIKPPVDMQGGYVLSLEQYRVTGLGLPGQIYYKSDEANYVRARELYEAHIEATLRLAGIEEASAKATQIVELETRFAHVMWDFAKLRDAGAAFDLITMEQLASRAPGFPWQTYFKAKGVGDLEHINFGIGGLTESAALFQEIPLDHWQAWAAYHWINNHADYLPDAFGQNAFEFYQRDLFGVTDRASRSARATEFIQFELGADVGALYTDRHFPPEYNAQIEVIAEYVRRAFRDQLYDTPWMDDATRAEALKKLDSAIFEFGEPQVGLDLSALETSNSDLIGNLHALRQVEWEAQTARIGQPVVRLGDWNLYPHRIGLGYHQQYNKIFITAGALLPPFYDPNADMAVNFGSIGSTIAHEFGHAFDDQGAKFDSAGALRDWWTFETREAHELRTRDLIDQFAELEVLPGVTLRSDQMIGEIVADLSGALVGHRALQLYLDEHPEEREKRLDGFTPEQRFWLGLVQKTRMVANRTALEHMAQHNSHPPMPPGVNGIVTNLEEWHRDFGVQPGHRLYRDPADRVRLW